MLTKECPSDPLFRAIVCVIMSSGVNRDSGNADPRVVELKQVESRLTIVMSHLKAKHTPQSIDSSIAQAEQYLNDHTPAFITLDSASFEGTRHVGSLMKLCAALEIKAEMGHSAGGALKECTRLLERKVQLLQELHGV